MINEIKKYYSNAKRVALLAQEKFTKKWFHIFSVIELLPEEIPEYNIPAKKWHKNTFRSDFFSNNYSFYLSVNDISSVDDAILLFNAPLQNTFIDKEKIDFFNAQFKKEPSGINPLVIPSNIFDDEGLASILPKRNSGIFLWSQIDYKRDVQKLFQSDSISKDIKAMSQLTLDWLGFDIWAKSEHIGNIYLCAPNPYFRDINISLSQNPNGIFYHFKLRKGIKENFILRVIDKHGEFIAFEKSFKLDNYIGVLEFPHEPHQLEIKIYNSNQDLIAVKKPAHFIKSIQLGMFTKQADFHVKVQSDNANKEFIVEKSSKASSLIVGKPSEFNAPVFFKNAENQRKHITHKKNKEFIFFQGSKSPSEKSELKAKSKKEIRDIINQSNETCYLCDPYFNVNDLLNYAFYIKNLEVKIRIVNCKENIDKNQAKLLFNAINEYNNKFSPKIECRILRGESILHDRFVISDLNVWYLGSSFSEFGNRATCIGKVPDSSNKQIIKEIEKWFYNKDGSYTQSIKEYIKEPE